MAKCPILNLVGESVNWQNKRRLGSALIICSSRSSSWPYGNEIWDLGFATTDV
jgi:hypothetical protein